MWRVNGGTRVFFLQPSGIFLHTPHQNAEYGINISLRNARRRTSSTGALAGLVEALSRPTNCPDSDVIQRKAARPLTETRAIDYTPIGSMDRAN